VSRRRPGHTLIRHYYENIAFLIDIVYNIHVNQALQKEVGTVLVEGEHSSISPKQVKEYTGELFKVYILPLRGNKLYRAESDGTATTITLVQGVTAGTANLVLGSTQEPIRVGETLVLQMNNGKQSKKVYPTMAIIYTTKRACCYTRAQALVQMNML
jgi:hypothetical protein